MLVRVAAGLLSLASAMTAMVLLRFSARRQIEGVWVAIPDMDTYRRCYPLLEQALGLLREYAPDYLTHLRVLCRGIVVLGGDQPERGRWERYTRVCVLRGNQILAPTASPEEIAMTLVHEVTHGWLYEKGIGRLGGFRAKAEVICAMAELGLTKRLPNSHNLQALAARALEKAAAGGLTSA